MTKALISVFALLVLCSVAQASPQADARRDEAMSQSHKYWLSDGLNRLVFWQPPAQSHKHVETRAE